MRSQPEPVGTTPDVGLGTRGRVGSQRSALSFSFGRRCRVAATIEHPICRGCAGVLQARKHVTRHTFFPDHNLFSMPGCDVLTSAENPCEH